MVEFSIPEGLPQAAVARLVELHQELEEGDITEKGYKKHREVILAQHGLGNSGSIVSNASDFHGHSRRQSGYESILSYQLAEASNIKLTEGLFPTSTDLSDLQTPLAPRGIPETANTDPLNVRVRLNTFDNLPSILRHRGRTNGDIIAYQYLDDKGKDYASITWGKLASKAEKVAQMLREQSGLFRGDRVVLMYADHEAIEFIVAMMGCFLAGLVAVPVSPEHATGFLRPVLNLAQSKLVLLTDPLHKRLLKMTFFSTIPSSVTFWKTSEWGSYKGGQLPPLQVPDLAYIEFLLSGSGDLRGVVMSHRTILHQMRCLTALTQSRESGQGRSADRVLCSLDIRRSTGMIFGVLLTVYAGNQVNILKPSSMAKPGLYAHLASRLRTTILLSDYSALKGVCYNYQAEPRATRNFAKRHDPSLAHVRWCLVDVPTIDPEFLSVLSERWLKPLGHRDPKSVAAPMLTLTEHGGMVVATKDFLTPGGGISEVQLSPEMLARNKIQFVNDGEVRVCTFGYPIPDAMVAVVDPETCIISSQDTVGEIWIDSPSLSGGFWDHADDTNNTFHAKCYGANGELSQEFLRTGLLGFTKDNKVYVLGKRVDRLVQLTPQPRYFYSYQLLDKLMTSVPEIFDGCIFQIPLKLSTGDEASSPLNVVLLESPKASIAPRKGNSLLEEMALQTIAVLKVYGFSVYAVVLCAPGSAPRTIRSGKPDIAKIAARRQFLRGQLPATHIKFDLDNAGVNLSRGDDVKGGIWSPAISHIRTNQLEANENEKQFSGVDMRTEVLDDRMATSLDKFETLGELMQWRVLRQPDELAYLTINATGMTKEISWRQFGARISAVYHYLTRHLMVKTGDTACLIYTHSEDYVHAFYACMLAGVLVIPVAPINIDRISEDVSALLKVIKQFKVAVLLGNSETHSMMEDKQLHQYLKARQIRVPKLHNTSKARLTDDSKPLSSIKPPMSAKLKPALVWLTYNADHDYTASMFTQSQILGMCKIQKETCQMSATKPIIGCVRSVSGLGFLYTCCLGVYLGAFTILLSPLDFANNPALYFVTTSRYKVKDGYGTLQMLQHASKLMVKPKGFDLSELQNLVIPQGGRADLDLVGKVRLTFASVGLENVAVNLAYGPVCNPMATTRSYMLVENIDLWLDPVAFRQGLVSVVNPNNTPQALHLVDSGMVPINTQVAIVNPETKRLCRVGEIGEIWVVSEGNQSAQAVQGSKPGQMLAGIFEQIQDGPPGIEYMRTGDLGFLHTVTNSANLEMQVLFVAGTLKHTFDFNGLQHFAEDVEATIVSSNPNIKDCVVAKCAGILCCIVETSSPPSHLCSLTAVIAHELITEHQLAPNIVSFLAPEGIPRGRLGEKQRKTLLQYYTGAKKPEVTTPGGGFKTLMDFTVCPVDF